MALGLLGKKLGMTHVHDKYGRQVVVTVLQAGPCTVLSLREPARHGYHALQIGFETIEEKRVTKPVRGQFKLAGTGLFRHVHEFRVPATVSEPVAEAKAPAGEERSEHDEAPAPAGWAVGQQLKVDLFKPYELVDVTAISIGKGFQGGMRRWNWKGGPQTHGSTSHRAPGSIGSTTFPGRVLRGHHLPGHMGARRVTIENLRVIRIDPNADLLLLEGAVPGPEHGLVIIEKSTKRFEVIKAPLALVEAVEEEEQTPAKKEKAKK